MPIKRFRYALIAFALLLLGLIIYRDFLFGEKLLLYSYTCDEPIIEINAVTKVDDQDAILSWIREMQAKRLIARKVEIFFYEGDNVTYYADDKARAEKHVAGKLLRGVNLPA